VRKLGSDCSRSELSRQGSGRITKFAQNILCVLPVFNPRWNNRGKERIEWKLWKYPHRHRLHSIGLSKTLTVYGGGQRGVDLPDLAPQCGPHVFAPPPLRRSALRQEH